MSTTTWTAAQDQYLRDNWDKLTQTQMAAHLGTTKGAVGGRMMRLRAAPGIKTDGAVAEGVETDIKEDSQIVTARSRTIRSLEDAIEAANVDLTIWEVERHVINKWDSVAKVRVRDNQSSVDKLTATELWQVKIWLRRIVVPIESHLVDDLIAQMKKFAPRYPRIARSKHGTDKFMFEVSTCDLHMGKLAWGKEVGESYDAKIAHSAAVTAIEELARRVAGFPIAKILFPVGNDLLHTDNAEGTTTAGTKQDMDSRWKKMYTDAFQVMVAGIDRLSQIAPVQVLVVPGNHDRVLAFCLGHSLECWYNRNPNVEVDNSPADRKYIRWGHSLIGFTHGNEEPHRELPGLMMRERPRDFADVTEAGGSTAWHLGHFHKKKETSYNIGDTFGGTIVSILPSLSSADAWHFNKGYVGHPRAAEAFLWHYLDGYAGHFSARVGAKSP